MNVNLTPPVEPSKIAPTAKSSAVSTDAAATESSGGFFAQLHALIFGSKTASDAPATSVTQTEGDTEAPVNTEAVLEADSDAALRWMTPCLAPAKWRRPVKKACQSMS